MYIHTDWSSNRQALVFGWGIRFQMYSCISEWVYTNNYYICMSICEWVNEGICFHMYSFNTRTDSHISLIMCIYPSTCIYILLVCIYSFIYTHSHILIHHTYWFTCIAYYLYIPIHIYTHTTCLYILIHIYAFIYGTYLCIPIHIFSFIYTTYLYILIHIYSFTYSTCLHNLIHIFSLMCTTCLYIWSTQSHSCILSICIYSFTYTHSFILPIHTHTDWASNNQEHIGQSLRTTFYNELYSIQNASHLRENWPYYPFIYTQTGLHTNRRIWASRHEPHSTTNYILHQMLVI